jgi:transcriptional regulator with XRE-family HTH domain
MKTREQMAQQITRHCIANENLHNFPKFLKYVITNLGLTMRAISKQIGLKGNRLNILCSVDLFRSPTDAEVKKLAEYFEISYDLLSRKLNEFLKEPIKGKK